MGKVHSYEVAVKVGLMENVTVPPTQIPLSKAGTILSADGISGDPLRIRMLFGLLEPQIFCACTNRNAWPDPPICGINKRVVFEFGSKTCQVLPFVNQEYVNPGV